MIKEKNFFGNNLKLILYLLVKANILLSQFSHHDFSVDTSFVISGSQNTRTEDLMPISEELRRMKSLKLNCPKKSFFFYLHNKSNKASNPIFIDCIDSQPRIILPNFISRNKSNTVEFLSYNGLTFEYYKGNSTKKLIYTVKLLESSAIKECQVIYQNSRMSVAFTGVHEHKLNYEIPLRIGLADTDEDGIFINKNDYLFFLNDSMNTDSLYPTFHCKPISYTNAIKWGKNYYLFVLDQNKGRAPGITFYECNYRPNKYFRFDPNVISDYPFDVISKIPRKKLFSEFTGKPLVIFKADGKEMPGSPKLNDFVSLANRLKGQANVLIMYQGLSETIRKKIYQLKSPENLIFGTTDEYGFSDLNMFLLWNYGHVYSAEGKLLKEHVKWSEIEKGWL